MVVIKKALLMIFLPIKVIGMIGQIGLMIKTMLLMVMLLQ